MSNEIFKDMFNENTTTGQDYLRSSFQAQHPSKQVYNVSKSVVIDSRQRNTNRYKYPNFYKLELGDVFKNISAVELKGIIIPKSSYNIHTSNNKIDFVIGDKVSSFKIIDGGSGYTTAPNITLSSPTLSGGTQATATSVINSSGVITNIILGLSGSGYEPSKPPIVFIDSPTGTGRKQAKIVSVVGKHYTAELRVGEYSIGGNPIPPSTSPSDLLLEIQNSMNYIVNNTVSGTTYDTASTSPFVVRVVSQYPELGATAGTPEAADSNACKFNRIQITKVPNGADPNDSQIWEILWGTGVNRLSSAHSVIGFNMVDTGVGITTGSINTGGGELIPAGDTIRALYDYNLKNDPDFVIMSLELGNENMDRISSLDDGLNDQFATIVFDANSPETLHDLSSGTGGSITNVGGIDYLEGPTGKGTFYREPGNLKSIKGADMDLKKYVFKPAKAKVSSMMIKFTKFGYTPGSLPRPYDFMGREHTLLLELTATAGAVGTQQRD